MTRRSRRAEAIAFALVLAGSVLEAANPYLPAWEFIPDGEPYVFEDPDRPGHERVYLYGSHDNTITSYCGRDQVVWSAPVEDLSKWRFDGVIFRSLLDRNGRRLDKEGLGDFLFAPDVAMTTDAAGKKTYWLFPNNMGEGRHGMAAKAERPDGPFVVSNWSADDPTRTTGVFDFDPAVFVDDDGRVYGYWGFEHSFAAELDPATMSTVKSGTAVVTNLVSGSNDAGVFRFYEASSMRKIKDKYVFIYSRWTAAGEFGLPASNYTLAYAYGDGPLGPFTYGGTLIDGRAREKRPDGTTRVTATPNGNTHGSICEIAGRWYVFYHRQCGTDEFSRQAMVAPVEVSVEPGPGGKVVITEGEYTSEGFELDGLDPLERHLAGIACHYTGPEPAVQRYPNVVYPGPYMEARHAPLCGLGHVKDLYDPKFIRMRALHLTSGSELGYRYFNFDRTFGAGRLLLELEYEPSGIGGRVTVWADAPSEAQGKKVGAFEILAGMPDGVKRAKIDVTPLACLKGKHALFFTFDSPVKGQSIASFEAFRFSVERASSEEDFAKWSPTPPMGWNSWDCYGPTVTEAQYLANVDVLAAKLKPYGYEYAVVDIRWTVRNELPGYNKKDPVYTLDKWGRYIPAPNRFPSSANGAGFRPLVDAVHAKGLKFGIHIMRGVPKEAVARKLPVKGGDGVTCDQVTDGKLECWWLDDNCTVKKDLPGAQAYYDSIFDLYASWGVDFVKVDDLSAPYHADEIEMIRKAIDRCGRRIVFSTSPGETPLGVAKHLERNANMWRMVNDVWDSWDHLAHLVPIACDWLKAGVRDGTWPDCDMIPLGRLAVAGHEWSPADGKGKPSALTPDEQRTLMNFFAICRSPLMIGAALPQLDDETYALLTDPLVLAAQRDGRNPRPLVCTKTACVIESDDVKGGKFVALFNLSDREARVSSGTADAVLPPHGSRLLHR